MANGEIVQEYKEIIRELSDRLVAIQKPVRILDTLKWDESVAKYFFEHKGKKLPPIDSDYYLKKNPLAFDPQKKIEEFQELDRCIRRKLGQFSGVGSIMQRMCYEYCRVIEMLQARGTAKFTEISQELYGSSEDVFHVGAPTLNDLATLATTTIDKLLDKVTTDDDEQVFTSADAVKILSERLAGYFADSKNIRVELSDGIIADAAAGADRIKIHDGLMFSAREIRTFEIHEGWVHLGTTLNGMAQPICTFLSKGPPSSTVTQEGLAIIMEIFTFSSYPERVRQLSNRIKAVNMAEQGANFFDVYDFFGSFMNEYDSYQATVRVFRGSTPDGGPYTKDLSYSKGFILIYNYMRLAVQHGMVKRIPLLFVGKTTLEDLHILSDLMEEGILVPPKYIPPQFSDLAAVSAWMIYSLFLNKLDLKRLAVDFNAMLR